MLKNLPTTGKKLDAIKISAIIAMLIAHINVIYFDNSIEVITFLSRGWFPLFCYALACSIIRIQDNNKDLSPYLVSLLILGAITQPFYNIGFDFVRANALFTLATGAAFAYYYDKMPSYLKITLILFAFFDAMFFSSIWEYSFAGTMMPATIMMIIRQKKWGLTSFLFMLYCANIAPVTNYELVSDWILDGIATWLLGIVGLILFFFIPAKLAPNKEGRLMPKYTMHIFYPAHLVILGLTAPFVKPLI